MNYIGTTIYRNDDHYAHKYNNMIEHFKSSKNKRRNNRKNNRKNKNSDKDYDKNVEENSHNIRELAKSAEKLWVSKSNGSMKYDKGGNATMTHKTENGKRITLLQHVEKMSDKEFNEAYHMLKRNTPKYVSQKIWGKFCETEIIHMEDNGFDNNGLCALKIYREQSLTGSGIDGKYSNNAENVTNKKQKQKQKQQKQQQIMSEQDDYELRKDQYAIEQGSLMKGQTMQNTHDTNLQTYNNVDNNSKQCKHNKKNNIDLEVKTNYINNIQQNVINDNKDKNKMLLSDIQTKDRQIQINQYEYFKKKDIVFYCKLIISIAGILAIIYSIGLKFPDKKSIFRNLAIVVLILGIILLGMKIRRDMVRDNLDWDEIEFPNYDWAGYGKDTNDASTPICNCPSSETVMKPETTD
jgi:hypothetical protein